MISIPKLSFTGGIWSPSLFSRTDLDKYNSATREMKNMFCHAFGGVSNRGGTQFIVEVKDSTKETRLLPFQFSITQAYVLEFGNEYIRVLKDGSLVVNEPGNGTDIVEAATYKWTASASGTNEYYLELLAGGDPGLDEPEYVFEDVGVADTVMPEGTLGSLSAGEYGYGDSDSLGYDTIYVRLTDNVDPDTKADGYLEASYIYEVVTPYAEADLRLLKVRQTNDVMYICHPSYSVRKLSRTAHDVWTLVEVSFEAAIAAPTGLSCSGTGTNYKVTAIAEGWIESFASVAEEGAPGNSLTWDAVTGAIYYMVYKEYPATSGMYFALRLTSSPSFTEPAGGLPVDDTLGAPEDNSNLDTADNYPGSCVFYGNRLVFFRTNNKPSTFFGSSVGDYERMGISAPIADDDSYEHILESEQAIEIKWGEKVNEHLMIGTSNSEHFASPASGRTQITPSEIDAKEQSNWGVSDVMPLKIGNTILFIESSGKVVRDYTYDYEISNYKGTDLSINANYLFEGKTIVAWCYQKQPHSIIWCVLDDGTLLGLTYNKEQAVWGWHRHETKGLFEDIIRLDEGAGVNNVYFIVRRYVNGSYKRYIELFKNRLPEDSLGSKNVKNAYFVDCGLSWDNPLDISAVTLSTSITITSNAHGLSDGDVIDIDELRVMYDLDGEVEKGTYELNGNRYYVSDSATNTFKLKDKNGNYIDGSDYTAYLSGGKIRKAITSISGLSHLEGEKVAVLADGNSIKNKIVSSGTITLSKAASRVHIGLGYRSELETLDFDVNLKEGPLKDRISNIPSALLELQDTRVLKIGPSRDRDLTELIFRTENDVEDTVELFSGDEEVSVESSEHRKPRLYVENAEPLPLTINSIIARVDYGDS